jgi:hypothetical protein
MKWNGMNWIGFKRSMILMKFTFGAAERNAELTLKIWIGKTEFVAL